MSKLTHAQVEAIYQKIASDEAISKSIENSPSPIFRANGVLSAVIKGLKGDTPVIKKIISKLRDVQELINDEGRKMSASKVAGVRMIPTEPAQIKIIEDIMSGEERLLACNHEELRKAWNSDATWDALDNTVHAEKGLETKLKRILAEDLLNMVDQWEDLKHENTPHFSEENKKRLLKAIEPFAPDRSKVKKLLGE